jgi:hypothetical protein
MTNNSPANRFALRKPDWMKWESADKAKLWHAVALACDLDPDNFGFFDLDKLRSNLGLGYPASFANLLKLAINDLGSDNLLGPANMADLEGTEVELSKFSAWLRTVGHKPPAEFRWTPDEMPSSNHVWPWGKYETKLLATLAQAVDHFWRDFDPDNPNPPKKLEVVDWLLAHGVPSENMAIAIATIIRPDGLPTRSKRK